jgi:predicted dehydrogenase
MIRAAVVGLGAWDTTRGDSVHGQTDEIRLPRACTRMPDKVADYGRAREIKPGSRYEDIVADRNIEAVVLATPNSQPETRIKQAAVTGKHIEVEMPLCSPQ